MSDATSQPGPEGAQRIPIRDKRRVRPEDLDAVAGAAGGVAEGDPSTSMAGTADEHDPKDEALSAKDEAAQYLDDLKRLKAEFDNYRKRVQRDQVEMASRGAMSVVAKLLQVLDNFELAVASAEANRDFERMLKGVEMVFGELKEVLAQEGLKQMPAKDQAFDPNMHEAALEVPGDEDGELVVAEVLRPGYMFKDRVLRPAMVKVTRRRDENG